MKKTTPLILITSALMIFGCGSSKPSRYYILAPVRPVTGNQATIPSSPIGICIRTLKLPDYLLRQQIVRRTSTNELQLAEFDRWAEPLENNFSRVLIEDLSADIPTNNIVLMPTGGSGMTNFQIQLEVTEFEKSADGSIVLSTRWGVEKGEGISFLMDKHTSYREQVSGEGFEAIAATMSKLMGLLSKDISEEVRSQSKTAKW